MAEWLKAPVLKTGDAQASGGSNPSPSANLKYARTRHNPEYAPDTGQFTLKRVYITPDTPS